VIDPPPFKVKQVCGTVAVASAQLTLQTDGRTLKITIHADPEGKFDFGNLSEGIYRLSMTWLDEKGNVQQPIHNSYPIRVVNPIPGASCERPLLVDFLRGSESGLTVSFLK
jgi:hypothetical protein